MNFMCPLCSGKFSVDEEIGVTKCGHVFHIFCCLQSIEKTQKCPICNVDCRKLKKLHFMSVNDTTISNNTMIEIQKNIEDELQEEVRQIKNETIPSYKAEICELKEVLLKTQIEKDELAAIVNSLKSELVEKEKIINEIKKNNEKLANQERTAPKTPKTTAEPIRMRLRSSKKK